jgi:hypothetical protein
MYLKKHATPVVRTFLSTFALTHDMSHVTNGCNFVMIARNDPQVANRRKYVLTVSTQTFERLLYLNITCYSVYEMLRAEHCNCTVHIDKR